MVRQGHLGDLTTDHHMTPFGSNACTAFAAGAPGRGTMVTEAMLDRHNENAIAAGQTADQVDGQEGIGGPRERVVEPATTVLALGVEIEDYRQFSLA